MRIFILSRIELLRRTVMTTEERQEFWNMVESGDNPLLSVMSNLVEKWGMPAIIMAMGDVAVVLSEDAIDAENLTPNQRGLIMSCCAQEMEHISSNQ